MKDNKLGEYSIKSKCSPFIQDQYLRFRVEKEGRSSQFLAELHLLTPKNINQFKHQQNFQVPSKISYCIEEIFFLEKIGNIYQVVVKDQQSERIFKCNLDNVLLSSFDCKRLAVEAVLLIQNFHKLGLRLNRSILDYLQFSSSKRYQNISINVLKLRVFAEIQSHLVRLIASQKLMLGFDKKLSKQEMIFLMNFYQTISQVQICKRGKSMICFIEFFGKHIQEQKEISLEVLKANLLAFQCRLQYFSFTCYFHPENTSINVQISDLRQQKMYEYTQKHFVYTIGQRNKISVDQFFFKISSLEEDELCIRSEDTIIFYDCESLSWRTVVFVEGKENQENEFEDQINGNMEVAEMNEQNTAQRKKFQEQYEQQAKIVQNQNIQKMSIKSRLNPYDFVVQVESFFGEKEGTVLGVGSLVGRKLVVTCAHLIRYTLKPGLPKATAKQLFIRPVGDEGRRIKVLGYEYPQDYLSWDSQKSRENDFALLYLSEGVEISSCLVLAQNYRTKSLIQMPKFRTRSNQKVIEIEQAEDIQILDTSVFCHHLKTIGGDSGTPILARVCKEVNLFLLISIHSCSFKLYSYLQSVKKGTKITAEVVEKLLMFEKRIAPEQDWEIQSLIIKYQSMLEKKDLIKAAVFQKLKPRQSKFESKERQFKIVQKFEGQDQQFLRIKKLAIKYLNTRLKSYFSLVNATQRAQYIKERNVIELECYDYWIQFLFTKQRDEFVNTIKKLVVEIITDQRRRVENICKILQILENQYKCSCQWQEVVLVMKTISRQPDAFLWKVLFKNIQIMEIFIIAKRLLQIIGLDINIDQFGIPLLAEMCKFYLATIQSKPMDTHVSFQKDISPFTFLRLSQFYPQQGLYQMELRVEFSTKAELLETFWMLMKYSHFRMVIILPKREIIGGSFFLNLKFYCNQFIQIDRLSEASLSLKQWLGILFEISDFIISLHKVQMHLCTPIEYCLFLNKQFKPYFYYFQSSGYLHRKIVSSPKKELAGLKQYYPVDEVIHCATVSNATFQKIDVWMLGKFFLRSQSVLFYQNADKFSMFWTQLIKKMTCGSERRISMVEVKQIIQNYLISINSSL